MLTIVMGPSCAGKSTYIQEHFEKSIPVFDLFIYQQNLPHSLHGIMESYQRCADDLCDALKNRPTDDVILEHTLLKRIRRDWYMERIRQVYDGPIEIICLKPSMETLRHNSKQRFGTPDSDWVLQSSLDILELPTMDEGYTNIKIIEC